MNSHVFGQVGERLRSIREQRGLSIRELASRSDVAVSFLSRIEAGKSSPTIITLSRVLSALEMEIADFFSDEAEGVADFPFVTRHETMRVVEDEDRCWRFALPVDRRIRAKITHEQYKPHTRESAEEQHATDVCGYVLEGELTLELLGVGTQTVRSGDAFYIPAEQTHVASNQSDEFLRMVVFTFR